MGYPSLWKYQTIGEDKEKSSIYGIHKHCVCGRVWRFKSLYIMWNFVCSQVLTLYLVLGVFGGVFFLPAYHLLMCFVAYSFCLSVIVGF